MPLCLCLTFPPGRPVTRMGLLSILYDLSDPSGCSCGKEDDCAPSNVGVGKIDLYSVDFFGDAIDEGADNE